MTFKAMSQDVARHGRKFQAAAWCGASIAIAIGIFGVVAWHSHSQWLWDAFPGMFYMKYNTALGFIASGAGLIAAIRGERRYTNAASAVVLAIGGVTLVEYLTETNIGLDELFLKDYWYPDNPLRGRMAPGVALALTCMGAALLLLAAEGRRSASHVMAMEGLAFIVLAAGATALAGYLTQSELAYSWGSAARVAKETSIGLTALGVGLVALIWQYQVFRVARVPLWLPALLCFIVLAIDFATPLGLAAGIAYVPIIFCSLWFTQPYMAFVFAAVTTALTVFGYLISSPGEYATWIPLANRAMSIMAMWFVATLVYLRRRAEHATERYMSELERSNQELDDFAYIASHDLKEPLRGLFNHASFLLEDYRDKLDDDGVRRLTRLGQLSQRMEQLINDLMYFSRLGRADLARQETDFNAVIADIQQMMETLLAERQARIVVPHPLPTIICDKTRVSEVFRNLITNAVKYNDKPEPSVEVGFHETITTPDGPEKNVFYVRDNGIGIERDFHQDIFRIFKRLHAPAAGEQAGSGVGLTFVKKIIERHGGRIWLESEPGQGTTFYFHLNSERKAPARGTHEPATVPVAVYSAG